MMIDVNSRIVLGSGSPTVSGRGVRHGVPWCAVLLRVTSFSADRRNCRRPPFLPLRGHTEFHKQTGVADLEIQVASFAPGSVFPVFPKTSCADSGDILLIAAVSFSVRTFVEQRA